MDQIVPIQSLPCYRAKASTWFSTELRAMKWLGRCPEWWWQNSICWSQGRANGRAYFMAVITEKLVFPIIIIYGESSSWVVSSCSESDLCGPSMQLTKTTLSLSVLIALQIKLRCSLLHLNNVDTVGLPGLHCNQCWIGADGRSPWGKGTYIPLTYV